MKLETKNIYSSVNKAYFIQDVALKDFKRFKKSYINLINSIKENETEETLKDYINDFLKNSFYKEKFMIKENINDIDLVIYNNNENNNIGVIVETKSIKNTTEMISPNELNKKALWEIILYYLEERITSENVEIKHLIITNTIDWYVFNASEFENIFYKNKELKNNFNKWKEGKLVSKNKDFFYTEIIKPFVEQSEETIICNYFKLSQTDTLSDDLLVEIYKVFSPEHLLKLSFLNDSNSLNQEFYDEILHIIGLYETNDKSQTIERKKTNERNKNSFLESVIAIIKNDDIIQNIEDLEQHGETKEEQIFSIALELSLTWVNRIIFLKLLESQLVKYNNGNSDYLFLNTNKIKDFDDLRELFFDILAIKIKDRKQNLTQKYKYIPYLNSSLFEQTELEKKLVRINHLKHSATVPVFINTVLKDKTGKKIQKELPLLEYFFNFLDSYNFASNNKIQIQETPKTLINSSVLGLIFEKLNGYKEGSFFTPGYVTMYICRKTVRKAVIQKFNTEHNWQCQSIKELYNNISKIDLETANKTFNTIRIGDPAVGSGHFLVSVLNELIAIKSELGIIIDQDGKLLRNVYCDVQNDEIHITHFDKMFEYNFHDRENQKIQETIFYEKRTLIENCLFGVDINSKSVQICRLRLWIELLKNSFYTTQSNFVELETLPNIDINIKCGNSLVSHFTLNGNGGNKMPPQKMRLATNKYKKAVNEYKNATIKEQKRQAEKTIKELKEEIARYANPIDEDYIKIGKIVAEIDSQKIFFSKEEHAQWQIKVKRLTKELTEAQERYEKKKRSVFSKALEWRFEFPEVLDNNGNFTGFDAIVGNPPYIDFRSVPKAIIDYLKFYKVNSQSNKINTYQYFIELGYNLLAKNGVLGFINPNQFLSIDSGFGTRKFLIENTQILFINDISYIKVFEKAATYTVMWGFKKHLNDKYYINYNKSNDIEELDGFKEKIDIDIVKKSEKMRIISQANIDIINKIEKDTEKLGTLCVLNWGTSKSGYGKLKILKEDYLKLSKTERTKYSPILQTRDIKNFFIDWKLEYIPKEIYSKNIIEKFKETPKILIARMTLTLQAAIDTQKRFVGKSTLITQLDTKLDTLFFIAILNSKLVDFWYSNYFENTHMAGGYKRYDIPYLKQIPIKIVSLQKQKKIINLTKKIIEFKEKNREKDIKELENKLNKLVYKLYNISEDEINIIENGTT